MDEEKVIRFCGDIHASTACNHQQWNTKNTLPPSCPKVMIILLYGSWNQKRIISYADRMDSTGGMLPNWFHWVTKAIEESIFRDTDSGAIKPNMCSVASVKVDSDDEAWEICTNEGIGALGSPPELPAILILGAPSSPALGAKESTKGDIRIARLYLNSSKLLALLRRNISDNTISDPNFRSFKLSMKEAWSQVVDDNGNLRTLLPKKQPNIQKGIIGINSDPALRLFIAGDRSQVGKSSVCMGLLGALLESGAYAPSDLAYIKPATQCEQPQLVAQFCSSKGIESCVPIGPIVYFKGFTRAFLRGELCEGTQQLLVKVSDAVDQLAIGKKVVIIDGVGYPAVGSITGTDNAHVAAACGRPIPFLAEKSKIYRAPVPVLLVGKSGVGDAVDSFNLNATYFSSRDVPVIGAVFNKLSSEGFYSLQNCKEAVTMYFDQFQPDRKPFGFIPEMPSMNVTRENMNSDRISEKLRLKKALEIADQFIQLFAKYVNVEDVIKSAKEATSKSIRDLSTSLREDEELSRAKRASPFEHLTNAKHPRATSKDAFKNATNSFYLTREQVEAMASAAGAASG